MKPKAFDVETFSGHVLQHRSENKLTRNQLSALIGCKGESVIRNIENRHHVPLLNVAFNLCQLMGKRIDDYMK